MSTGVARSLATEMTTVGDVMTRNLLTVEQETTLTEAAAAMTGRQVGAVLVVSGGRLTGILTERDVLRAVASGDVGGSVADWMTHGPETVDADETTQQAGVVMIHRGLRPLPRLGGRAPGGVGPVPRLMRGG